MCREGVPDPMSPRRRAISPYLWVGLELIVAAGASLACAHDLNEVNAESAENDGGTESDASVVEASADVDAEREASACSDANLCIVDAPIDPSTVLNSIWGSSANDVYAVGNDSLVAHYDGTTWERAAKITP